MTYYYRRDKASFAAQRGKISLSLAIIFGLFFLSVAYLAQINEIVAKNFVLRSAQASLKQKEEVNQRLLVSLTKAKSLVNLEEAAKVLRLISIEKIDYLKVSSGAFILSQRQ